MKLHSQGCVWKFKVGYAYSELTFKDLFFKEKAPRTTTWSYSFILFRHIEASRIWLLQHTLHSYQQKSTRLSRHICHFMSLLPPLNFLIIYLTPNELLRDQRCTDNSAYRFLFQLTNCTPFDTQQFLLQCLVSIYGIRYLIRLLYTYVLRGSKLRDNWSRNGPIRKRRARAASPCVECAPTANWPRRSRPIFSLSARRSRLTVVKYNLVCIFRVAIDARRGTSERPAASFLLRRLC